MSWPILLVIALLLLSIIAAILRRIAARGRGTLPYALRPALYSPAERSFLGVLEQAVGRDYRIFGKVRIADVVATKRGLSASAWQSAFNRISGKHFDFLLCDKHDLAVICAIELDDRSHRKGSRQRRDAFVVDLCRTVGLPLVRVTAKRAYAMQELRKAILDATQRRLEPSLTADAAN